jgi:tetratricopeptide (TPR) repeat protein
MRRDKVHVVEHGGVQYTWSPQTGFVDRNYLKPPTAVESALRAKLRQVLDEEDAKITRVPELLSRAVQAKNEGDTSRAIRLARRALDLEPGSDRAAAVLSSALRRQLKPAEAIEATEAFRYTKNVALLTSRAAAFLDLGRCEEARSHANRAWAILCDQNLPLSQRQEISLVFQRIKSECD